MSKTNKTFLRVEEVMTMLDISKSKAYQLMRAVNKSLEDKGYITIAGRVNREVLMHRLGIEN